MRKGKKVVKRRNTATSPKEIEMSIEQAFDYFLAVKKTEGVRDRTVRDYREHFEYFTDWLSEPTDLTDITTQVIRDYIVYMKEERFNDKTGELGLSNYTINIRLRFLKTLFNTLASEGVIEHNPTEPIKLLRVDEDAFEPLTDEEVLRLLDAPNTEFYSQFRDKVALYLLLDTGMRVNEVFNLEESEINFKGRTIELPASKNKNRKPRVIPMSPTVVRLLIELISENKQYFDSPYVFLSNYGGRYKADSFRRRLLTYKKSVGIEKRVSPHSLRHQFCRDYILNGGDIFTLQRIVGHADIQTTRKYVQMTGVDIQGQHAQFSPLARLRRK